MKKKKIIKNGPGRPSLHPYSTMSVGDVNVREFKTAADRLNARCAAHMVGMRYKKKFDTKYHCTCGDKFGLTVTRVL